MAASCLLKLVISQLDSYNPGQNIWNKIEKSNKIRQEKKGLISTFVCFLTAIAKIEFLEGRPGAGLCLHPNLRYF